MADDQSLITILEDSREIRDLLTETLQHEGFDTLSFARATEFERNMRGLKPDVCIIDLGLPDRDGLSVVNTVASNSGAAVLIISGRSNTQDKIVGLELGADDYITKPFEIAEVVARVKALLRRKAPKAEATLSKIVRFNGWTADLEQHLLTSDDGKVERLSFAEGQVLRVFLSKPNRLITRDQILDDLSNGESDNFDRTIDVRISRLRAKLHDDPNNPKVIKTIYGAGYIFIAQVG
ncbi:DNA-binding response regulator, OmpR family, contains REC and winged-helix (wHTH) domain [Cognatiyoonia sediminum]|uniref:Regulatory protein VirG n=1 Tax=Cognatiyoonia sediminum TaxID=1508389 RepID=A0A1M5QXD7_9RHOB|nr:response regulator transcription factor [Cognatiyoonia sediminum]SHH18578.1 DNA-binding response regulator, OmpR family, contains REC and winged-helix (wHTH) domain [Cognatiyoonia sediminum]